MYQLTVSTRRELERATLRAQAQKPRISETVFGIYKVWSSNPAITDPYLVGIEALEDGGYDVCCSCPTQRYLCKHVAAVFPHYLMRLKEQVEPEAAQAAPDLPKCQCGKDGFAFFNGTWHCIECIKGMIAAQLPPVEVARAQAEQALAALVVNGVITTSSQELDRLIEQAKEESMDRECPKCGLVQPDDDSTNCWCCGATLNPDDVDPEYSDEQAAFDRECLFG